MELKYDFLIYICIFLAVIAVVLFVIGSRKKRGYNGGSKIAGLSYIEGTKQFKTRRIIYRIFSIAAAAGCIMSLVFSVLMVARPYKTTIYEEQKYSRDIIICMDISTSVDDLNVSMMSKLKGTVKNLKNERIGIVIFNTSPVLLCPLTDDYEYVLEVLDQISEGLKARSTLDELFSYTVGNWEDYYYKEEYISSGTLVGNEERGSSLIGDGLAGAAYSFYSDDEDRTKVIIFTSDNEVEGEPVLQLTDAAAICASKDIVVYGIGTAKMKSECEEDMKAAVESTGGTYFRENQSGSMDTIVSEIEEMSGSLVGGIKDIRETDHPEVFIGWLVAFTVLTEVAAWVIKV